uniref:Uncharacterized protein n=1 Tax=Amphiprion ocellaris TaxID=80972 RepID=A0A3Q1CEZ2_AMPOC
MQRKIDQIFKRKISTEKEYIQPKKNPREDVSQIDQIQDEDNEDNRREPAAAAESEASPGDATSNFPSIWTKEQYHQFKDKNEWLFAKNGMLGCTLCHNVKDLGVMSSRGVNIAANWAEGKICLFGQTREIQLTSLRKKIHEHKNSLAHKEADKILQTAKKDILMNINATSQEFAFETTARVFRTAYYVAKSNKPFTDFESLIDLQEANSMNLGHVLHSKTVCVDIVDHVASQMKNEILKKIIKNKSKITILADESTTVGNKSTLIVFLKASVDGAMEPIAFPLELVELDSLNELIGFCSDGASVMLGVKSGVGKLLKDDFPSIVLWHCLNHRLVLAVDQALDKTGGTKDFHAFLDSLYALYSQSPKNTRKLSECAHNLHITLRRIGKVFTVRWVASSWRAVSAVWQSYPALAQHFREASEDHSRDSKERAKFSGLLSKLCSVSFVKSLALMVDILTELKNLSEILQSRKTTIPKAHEMMTIYVQRIESLCDYPGKHTVEAVQSEQKMIFKGEQLRVGKSPTIDSVHRKEAYNTSGGRSIPDKLKKLFTAVNTLSASNADCERGFSTMNNILTEYRGRLTTVNASNLLLISSVGPPCKKWDPLPYVKTWLGKGRRAAHATSGMARNDPTEDDYFSPLWDML